MIRFHFVHSPAMLTMCHWVQLPASFFAYRKQQHRWTCGPVQLWRKAAVDIWNSSLPLFSKLDLIVCYFGIRKFATHWVSLGFFCTIVPLSVFTPEVGTALCTMCNAETCNIVCNLFSFCAAAQCAKLTVNLPTAELCNTHAVRALVTHSSGCCEGMQYHCCCLACLQMLRQFDGFIDCTAIMLQVSIPLWALVHLPVVVTVTTAIFTPKGWLHCILYVLFENAMGIVKLGAVIAGTHANHFAVALFCTLTAIA